MILFFYGEETYWSSQKVIQLKKNFLKKNPTGGGLIVFDCGEECDIVQIILSVGEQNLFASKKLIIVKDLFACTKAPEQKKLKEVLVKDVKDVVVFFESKKVRKNVAFFKWLIKNAQVVHEGNMLSERALEQWIIKTTGENNCKICADAITELVLFVGNDLWKLSREIEKLACYAYGGEITVRDVRDIVHGRIDADMFRMVEAIVMDNKSVALTLLKKQIASGDAEFHIFSMYVYQIRTLLFVSGLMQEGVMDKSTIAKILGIHPFVVQKSLAVMQKLSHEKVAQMHRHLTILDQDIKQGNRDIGSALDLFVVIPSSINQFP